MTALRYDDEAADKRRHLWLKRLKSYKKSTKQKETRVHTLWSGLSGIGLPTDSFISFINSASCHTHTHTHTINKLVYSAGHNEIFTDHKWTFLAVPSMTKVTKILLWHDYWLACRGGAVGSITIRAAWLRWSASLGSKTGLARSLCQVIAAYALRINSRAGTEGSTVSSLLICDRWLILGLETFSISRCLNHW